MVEVFGLETDHRLDAEPREVVGHGGVDPAAIGAGDRVAGIYEHASQSTHCGAANAHDVDGVNGIREIMNEGHGVASAEGRGEVGEVRSKDGWTAGIAE
jgi:hypothetical protein